MVINKKQAQELLTILIFHKALLQCMNIRAKHLQYLDGLIAKLKQPI